MAGSPRADIPTYQGRRINHKRKAAKEKRKRMAIDMASSEAMRVLRDMGYPVDRPEDMAAAIWNLAQRAQQAAQPVPVHVAQPHPSQVRLMPEVEALLDGVAMGVAEDMARHQAPLMLPELSDPFDDDFGFGEPRLQTALLAQDDDDWDLSGDIIDAEPVGQQVYDDSYQEESPPAQMGIQDMVAVYNQRTSNMLNRVAETGIQHRSGAQHPSAGRPVAADPRVARDLAKAGAQVTTQPTAPQPYPRGERVNPKTGLTPSQAAALVARARGRNPEDLRSPAGRPNTLDR